MEEDDENDPPWDKAYMDNNTELTFQLVMTNSYHDTLAELYHRHSEKVMSIWTSSTVSERRKLFRKAWPHDGYDRIWDLNTPKTTETKLWPSLNISVLTDRPEPLLSFLYYRATNPPTAFRDMDFRSTFLDHENTAIRHMDDFPWIQSICSGPAHHMEMFQSHAEVTFLGESPLHTIKVRGRKYDEHYFEYWNYISARQVADIQARLYGVLVDVIERIVGKADIVLGEKCNKSLYPRLRTENLTTPQWDNTTSLISYYYGPPGFDHLGLAELVDDEANKVDGHMFSLRCSRNSFIEAVQERRSIKAVADPCAQQGENPSKYACANDCLSADVVHLDLWTALQDIHRILAQALEADNTSLSYMLFAMIKTHLSTTLDALLSAFGELWLGVDYSSSAYFEELKPGKMLGQKADSLCIKTYEILKQLADFGTIIDFPENDFIAVLSQVQRLIKNPKCRLRPAVWTLLDSIIVTAHCQHQFWLHFKRHVDYDRALRENNDDTIVQAVRRSIRDARETWEAFFHPDSALTIHNTLERCIDHPQLQVDKADPELFRRESEKEFDARWQDLIDYLDTHEALTDAAIVTLRRYYVRNYWPPFLEPKAPEEDLLDGEEDFSDGEDCPTLIDATLKSLWDETRAAQDERLQAQMRDQLIAYTGDHLKLTRGANTAAAQPDTTDEDAIQVRKDTYNTL